MRPINPTATNKKRTIATKLTVVARQMRQNFDRSVQETELTRAQWALVAVVARNPGATQRAIAESLEVREITAGRLIDRLCDSGHLKRAENPSDRRAYCVYLAAGAQPMLLQKLEEFAKLYESEIFAGFDDQDLTELDNLLDSITHDLNVARNAGSSNR